MSPQPYEIRRNPEDYSLIQILNAEHGTGFDGEAFLEKSIRFYQNENIVVDSLGNYFTNPHDHFSVKHTMQSDNAGILVADTNNKHMNFTSSEYTHLPHPIGLYVREDARGYGVASDLMHEFMDTVEEDTCVIDCEHDVIPFYEQLDCDIIYAAPMRYGLDVDRYHTLLRTDKKNRDVSASPEHNVPLCMTPEEKSECSQECPDEEPFLRIQAYNYPQCRIAVDMPYSIQKDGRSYHMTLTESTATEINSVFEKYDDCAKLGEFKGTQTDFIYLLDMLPDDARQLADALYPILTDESNLEPEQRAQA